MRIEKFSATDMSQVIKLVKQKLGNDAVILSNEFNDGRVEVLAAAEYDEGLLDQLSVPVLTPAGSEVNAEQPIDISLVELQAELRELRQTVNEEITELNAGIRSSTPKGVMCERLTTLGLSEHLVKVLAERLPPEVKKPPGWNQILKLVSSLVKTTGDELLEEGGVFALVGSTGVGKTTTVAKLATQFTYRHGVGEVALITTDTMRIGGQEQLATFARALGVPLSIATNVSEMTRALSEYRNKKLVLIDTAGMSRRDLQLSRYLNHVSQAAPQIKTLLVLSSIVQPGLTQEVIAAFDRVPLYAAVLTKTDEALQLGQVLSGILPKKLPLAYICNGKSIPEDVEVASRELLTSILLQLVKEASLYAATQLQARA